MNTSFLRTDEIIIEQSTLFLPKNFYIGFIEDEKIKKMESKAVYLEENSLKWER